jgi:hypothetical protein
MPKVSIDPLITPATASPFQSGVLLERGGRMGMGMAIIPQTNTSPINTQPAQKGVILKIEPNLKKGDLVYMEITYAAIQDDTLKNHTCLHFLLRKIGTNEVVKEVLWDDSWNGLILMRDSGILANHTEGVISIAIPDKGMGDKQKTGLVLFYPLINLMREGDKIEYMVDTVTMTQKDNPSFSQRQVILQIKARMPETRESIPFPKSTTVPK